MACDEPYFSVSTLNVKPENMHKIVEFFTKVSAETHRLEPAAKTYTWYKVEDKNQFVYIEKFASEAAYRKHQNSEHVQRLYMEYLPYITEPFVFYPIDTKHRIQGGF